jgi:hypothetical protein
VLELINLNRAIPLFAPYPPIQEVEFRRCISDTAGVNKLFLAGSRRTMYETLVEAKVPFPRLMSYFVSVVGFVGGSLLTMGFLSSLACMALVGRYASFPDGGIVC